LYEREVGASAPASLFYTGVFRLFFIIRISATGEAGKTLYVKPFEDQFGAGEKIGRKEGWRDSAALALNRRWGGAALLCGHQE